MNTIYSAPNASTWLASSKLRRLRGKLCPFEVVVKEAEVETRSSFLCSIVLNKCGLINRIPYDAIVSVDLKSEEMVELIFNPDQYLERKLNIYVDNAEKLANVIMEEM